MTTATVMTAREAAQQIKFRACLATAVLHKARSRVKDHIRAEGGKVHHYSASEITELAERYLAEPGHRESLMELVRPWVEALIFKTTPKSPAIKSQPR